MFKVALSLLSLLFLQISFALDLNLIDTPINDSTDVGNGGDAIVCTLPDGTITYEMLDIMEGREVYGLTYQWPMGSDEYAVAQSILNRMQRVSLHRWKRLTHFLNKFAEQARFGSYDLTPIDDSDHPLIPSHCEIKQIARQEKPIPGLGDIWYLIDEGLYQQMDVNNKAALILHEILYREAIQNYSHTNSVAARAATAQLAADHYQGLTDRELFEQLLVFNYPEFEYNNLLFTVSSQFASSPTWFSDGRVKTIPCHIKDSQPGTLCKWVSSNGLFDIYGFSDAIFNQGLALTNQLDVSENYFIEFGETAQAKNLAYYSQSKDDQFQIGNQTIEIQYDTSVVMKLNLKTNFD